MKYSVGYGLQAHDRDFAEKLSIKSAEPFKNFPRFASAHCKYFLDFFTGLSYIDDERERLASPEDIEYFEQFKRQLCHEKATSIENIELKPNPKRLFKREIESPTKSLQFEDSILETHSNRRSSLCILALKTAALKASSTPFLKSSEQSSLSSMISLPGVPPVQGVNEVSQVQLHRQKSRKAPTIAPSSR